MKVIKEFSKISVFILTVFFLLDLSFYSNDCWASSNNYVAKVIILRGNVNAIDKTANKKWKLKKGDKLSEGIIIRTAPKSFAKLLFVDKSQMSLGPNSEMAISKFPKKKAGIINLMKGQLRTKVSKDYMGIQDKKKSKLFIKTKNAAMGVRGTDFQVVFNIITQETGMVAFSGLVAMVQISDKLVPRDINQNTLERLVSSKNAVFVEKGSFSKTGTAKVTVPIKVPAKALKSLQAGDTVKATKLIETIFKTLSKTASQEEKEKKKEKKDSKKEKKKDQKKEDKQKKDPKKTDSKGLKKGSDKITSRLEPKGVAKGRDEEKKIMHNAHIPPGLTSRMADNTGNLESQLQKVEGGAQMLMEAKRELPMENIADQSQFKSDNEIGFIEKPLFQSAIGPMGPGGPVGPAFMGPTPDNLPISEDELERIMEEVENRIIDQNYDDTTQGTGKTDVHFILHSQ